MDPNLMAVSSVTIQDLERAAKISNTSGIGLVTSVARQNGGTIGNPLICYAAIAGGGRVPDPVAEHCLKILRSRKPC